MDPLSRRFLWSVVRSVVGAGQSVVLTTHSMAECEALCSRVGIMVNGSFCCLGSIQQLKSAYGNGYRLKIRVAAQIEEVKEFIRQNLTNAILKVINKNKYSLNFHRAQYLVASARFARSNVPPSPPFTVMYTFYVYTFDSVISSIGAVLQLPEKDT